VLSNSFVDGFRNQGDYDLRNNTGSSVTQARKKNGFFDNSFVTSADWAGNDGFPTNTSKNSYLTNGVTPIQRRTLFPEYVMEICRKLPVSECKPDDWVFGFDINGDGDLNDTVSNIDEKTVKADKLYAVLAAAAGTATDIPSNEIPSWSTPFGSTRKNLLDRLGAGTTAKTALDPEDQRYARRVAFARNPDGTLKFIQIGDNAAARPLGVGCSLLNGCEYPDNRNPTAGTNYGIQANNANALWFRTTNNQSGKPGEETDITYASDKPLFYLPPEKGEKLILPDIPDIPALLPLSLNSDGSTSGKSPSDYLVCVGNGANTRGIEAYEVTFPVPPSPPPPPCPADVGSLIKDYVGNASSGLLSLPATITNTIAGTEIQTLTLNADRKVNIYDITNFKGGAKITLNAGTQADPIFVLRAPRGGAIKFGDNCPPAKPIASCGDGVELTLNGGVSANNVLWVFDDSAPSFERVKQDKPHILKGNFLGNSRVPPNLGENTRIEGGRFLGFASAPNGSFTITAITSNGQLSLVPVLQIHSPEGSPSSDLDISGDIRGRWLQQVEDNTTVNAVFVSGNSPSRRDEESAGLHNFVRFLENWDRKTLNIKGSFIQFRRSAFATGPFATILSSTATTPESATNNLSLFDYLFNTYRTENGTPPGTLPYFNAPNREWSFDVGLLSQSPDLFAQKFTQQPVNPANEFFREVSRDDEWIETLLCAAAQDSENNYTYVIDASERPNNCPALTAYNDSPLVSDSGE